MQSIPDQARCIACNYPLRSLPNPRCPECGRPFNPNDALSMNLGRVPGPIARRFLKHTGWPMLLLAMASAIILFLASGPPRIVSPKLIDTVHYLDRRHWQANQPLGEKAYIAAILLWIGILGYYFLRLTVRLICQRIYKLRFSPAKRPLVRRTVFATALLFSIAVILYAWPLRVARRWIAQSKPPPAAFYFSPPGNSNPCPFAVSQSEQIMALQVASASRFQTRRARIAALNLFVEQFPPLAVEQFQSMIDTETDQQLRVLAVHVVGLTHNPKNASLFVRLLDDSSPAMRAASADAIDILRGSGVTRPRDYWIVPPTEVIADPPINVAGLLGVSADPYRPADILPPVHFADGTRDKLETMMTSGQASEEREAAARAIVNWPPPNYQLRAAEWGVWIADAQGNLAIAQSLLEEIPPFVHRIGNPHNSFADRYPQFFGVVKKPIIHLTVDHPLALDIQAFIYFGRPWFAYPRPDDLTLSLSIENQADSPQRAKWNSAGVVTDLDNPAFPSLPDLHEGYPWLNPPHHLRLEDSRSGRRGIGRPGPNYFSLGLRWQSLIVLPNQAPWMTPPQIPADPKFKWWADLRNVPSSYISSRGDSERFLYYDGPTHAKPPLLATLKDNTLSLRGYPDPAAVPHSKRFPQPNEITPLEQDRTDLRNHREAFFIRVTNGQPTAIRLPLSAMRFARPDWNDAVQTLPGNLPIKSTNAIAEFKKLLTDYGLTSEESQGLIDAWQTQFFHTNGQRLLLRLSAPDYDALCPISIKPAPTILVRLGFVLTEFGEKQP